MKNNKEDNMWGSETKRAEICLKIINNASDAILYLDMNYNILSWNKAAENIYGWSADDVIGKSLLEIIPVEFPDDKLGNILRTFKNNGHWEGVGIQNHRDGTLIHILSSSVIIKDKNGKDKGIVTINRDITARKKSEQNLKNAKEKLQTYIDNSPDGFFVVNKFGKYVDISPSACEMIGYSRDEILNMSIPDLAENKEDAYKCFMELQENGKWMGELELKKKEGFYVPVYLTSVVLPSGDYMAFCKDITEQKRAEQNLINTKHNLRERVKELICLYGLSTLGEIQDISIEDFIQGALELFPPAWQFPEITSARITFNNREFRTNNFKATEWNLLTSTYVHEKKMSVEVFYLENKPFLIEEEHLISEIGKRLKIILEKKEFEDKLKKSEEDFRSTFEQTAVGVAHTSLEGKFLRVNRKLCDILGYTREDLLGFTFLDITHPDDLSGNVDARDKLIKGEILYYNTEKRYKRKDGSFLWTNLTVSTKSDTMNNIEYFIAIVKDISEKRLAEQKLKEALKRAEFYKDLFAHDMTNVLQNIKASVQLAELKIIDTSTTEEMIHYKEMIKEQVDKGVTLVRNVRRLSKLENEELPIFSVDAMDILKKTTEYVLNRFAGNNVSINIESIHSTAKVTAGDFLEDAFENILINAVRHNPSDEVSVIVKVSRLSDYGKHCMRFEFIDNGSGIPDEMKEKIFERGYKSDQSITGMGIGLSLVKKITESYGGRIWVEDRVKGDFSKGSNFVVFLPLVDN